MESIKIDDFIKVLREKSISLFTLNDISKLFNAKEDNIKSALSRFKKKGIIKSLVKNKYIFELVSNPPAQYQIANFIYPPSYISLESALSLYGIIDQFPYAVTSITPRRSKTINSLGIVYEFIHVDSKIFRDYLKQDNYLIASPLKAIFDYFYLAYKNTRSKNNLSLLNLENKQIKELINYIQSKIELKSKEKLISYIKNNYVK